MSRRVSYMQDGPVTADSTDETTVAELPSPEIRNGLALKLTCGWRVVTHADPAHTLTVKTYLLGCPDCPFWLDLTIIEPYVMTIEPAYGADQGGLMHARCWWSNQLGSGQAQYARHILASEVLWLWGLVSGHAQDDGDTIQARVTLGYDQQGRRWDGATGVRVTAEWSDAGNEARLEYARADWLWANRWEVPAPFQTGVDGGYRSPGPYELLPSHRRP